jgi:hypothetical protein
MRWQFYPLHNVATNSSGTTLPIDLPEHGLVSSIYLEMSASPASDAFVAAAKWRIKDYISSIRVMGNTGNPIKFLNGRCLQALAVDDGWPSIVDQDANYATTTMRWHIPINFGRYPCDPSFGLDLSQFDNIQLQITNDLTTALVSAGISVNVHLLLAQDVDNPRMFTNRLETIEYANYLTVQNATEPNNFPTEGKLRRILWQIDPYATTANNADCQLYRVIDNIKLTLKTGQAEHVNHSPRDLWEYSYLMGRKTHLVGGEPYFTDNYGWRTGLGQTLYKAQGEQPQSTTPGAHTTAVTPGGDNPTQTFQRSGSDNDSWLLLGHGLENTVILPFDKPRDPEDYLDLDLYKTVKQELHVYNASTAANGTVRTVIDRLMPNY